MLENLENKLQRLANESEQELKDMGFQDKLNKKLYYTISNAKTRLGQCRSKKYINISKWLLEIGTDKEIKNTIIHEILHTFDDTVGHKGKWKIYAEKINSFGVYNITRTTSILNIMSNNNVDEDEIVKTLGKRYKIECLTCGHIHYQNRLQNNTINSYKSGHMEHRTCKGNKFKITDLKENKVIVNGIRVEL